MRIAAVARQSPHQEKPMTTKRRPQQGDNTQDEKASNPKLPLQTDPQDRKHPPVRRGERPIADVDRKVRGGDA
jgi:hypothetical protein